MLAPILPRPIMPICIVISLGNGRHHQPDRSWFLQFLTASASDAAPIAFSLTSSNKSTISGGQSDSLLKRSTTSMGEPAEEFGVWSEVIA